MRAERSDEMQKKYACALALRDAQTEVQTDARASDAMARLLLR